MQIMVSNYFSTHYRTIKRLNKIARIELSLVNLQLFTCVDPFFNNFKLLKSRNRLCPSFSLLGNFFIHLYLNFLSKPRKNDKKVAFCG